MCFSSCRCLSYNLSSLCAFILAIWILIAFFDRFEELPALGHCFFKHFFPPVCYYGNMCTNIHLWQCVCKHIALIQTCNHFNYSFVAYLLYIIWSCSYKLWICSVETKPGASTNGCVGWNLSH